MKNIFYSILLIITLVSCKKETGEISISGQLMDPNAGSFIAGATVSIQANGVIDGVYNAGYTTLASGVTDINGAFDFNIEESAYDSFRFTFIKDGYYVTQEIKSGGSIDEEHPFSGSFYIYSKSIIKLTLRNISPYDNQDIISYYYTNPPLTCSECCSSDPLQFTGMNIDTVLYCSSYGNYDLIMSYAYTKNGGNSIFNDTLHTIASDTTSFNILY